MKPTYSAILNVPRGPRISPKNPHPLRLMFATEVAEVVGINPDVLRRAMTSEKDRLKHVSFGPGTRPKTTLEWYREWIEGQERGAKAERLLAEFME